MNALLKPWVTNQLLLENRVGALLLRRVGPAVPVFLKSLRAGQGSEMLPTLKILRTHLIFISPSHLGLPPSYDSKGIRGIFLRDCTRLS